MRAYFGQLDGFDEGSQWAGHVEEFNKKTQWTIVFSLTQVEKFSQIWVQIKGFKTRRTIVFSQTG